MRSPGGDRRAGIDRPALRPATGPHGPRPAAGASRAGGRRERAARGRHGPRRAAGASAGPGPGRGRGRGRGAAREGNGTGGPGRDRRRRAGPDGGGEPSGGAQTLGKQALPPRPGRPPPPPHEGHVPLPEFSPISVLPLIGSALALENVGVGGCGPRLSAAFCTLPGRERRVGSLLTSWSLA